MFLILTIYHFQICLLLWLCQMCEIVFGPIRRKEN